MKFAASVENAKILRYVYQKQKARQLVLTSLVWFEPQLRLLKSVGGGDRTRVPTRNSPFQINLSYCRTYSIWFSNCLVLTPRVAFHDLQCIWKCAVSEFGRFISASEKVEFPEIQPLETFFHRRIGTTEMLQRRAFVLFVLSRCHFFELVSVVRNSTSRCS